jgi:hypothetical protein
MAPVGPTQPVPARQLPHLPPPQPYLQRPRPKSYMSVAVLATIFCFWPFGIVSIIMAASVGSRWARGDVEGANRASRLARAWAVASVVAMFCLFTIFYVFAGTMWRMGRH